MGRIIQRRITKIRRKKTKPKNCPTCGKFIKRK